MTNQKITAATTDIAFMASDAEMLAVEAKYTSFEKTYADKLANIERDYPDYHAYHKKLDSISHNPYVLASICSAIKPNFHADDPEIIGLLKRAEQPRRQYTLTVTPVLADEYATQFKDKNVDGLDRRCLDLNVKFTNYDLHCTIDSLLTHDQMAAYAGFWRNSYKRADLFPVEKYPYAKLPRKGADFELSDKLLEQYPILRRELKVALPLMGYPYVWGGSDAETSFDCSGFICYVLDKMGYNYRNIIRGKERRLAVAGSTVDGVYYEGIYDKCQPVGDDDCQPGDLVFFAGTFDANYRPGNLTHVGIYVGNDTFLACGQLSGVSYQTLDMTAVGDKRHGGKSWHQLLYGFGRLPGYEKS